MTQFLLSFSLIETCEESAGAPIISCMGTGNKLDPFRFEIADISKTEWCALWRKLVRTELRKRGIKKVKVLYSREKPLKCLENTQ